MAVSRPLRFCFLSYTDYRHYAAFILSFTRLAAADINLEMLYFTLFPKAGDTIRDNGFHAVLDKPVFIAVPLYLVQCVPADNADSVIIAVCKPVHTCLLLYMDYSHSTITAGISQQLFHVFIFLFFGRKLFVYALFQRILDDKKSLFVINKVTS